MSGRAIIVSHGQPSEPDPAEIRMAGFAAEVARNLPGWHVGGATLAKPGALDAALCEAGAHPLISPMFMSAGWFTGAELLKRLNDRQARVLPPLGLDPELPLLAARLLGDALGCRGWKARQTRLFIAAHGSARNPNPARDTRIFADALAGLLKLAEIRVGFVEEPPFLADMARDLGSRAICLPFFAAKGRHVLGDIPEALDAAGFKGVCLDPIGSAPGTAVLVARALERARLEA